MFEQSKGITHTKRGRNCGGKVKLHNEKIIDFARLWLVGGVLFFSVATSSLLRSELLVVKKLPNRALIVAAQNKTHTRRADNFRRCPNVFRGYWACPPFSLAG